MYRSFVRETNSMFNTRLENQSLLIFQVFTQQNQSGLGIIISSQKKQVEPPTPPPTPHTHHPSCSATYTGAGRSSCIDRAYSTTNLTNIEIDFYLEEDDPYSTRSSHDTYWSGEINLYARRPVRLSTIQLMKHISLPH